MSSGRRLSASAARKVRKDRAQHSNLRPSNPSTLGLQARPALKANPGAMEPPGQRATQDRKDLPARKGLQVLPGRAESPDRRARLGRKGPLDLRDQQEIRKRGPSLKGSQALRAQRVLSGPKARRVLPARRGHRGLQATRDRRDLRGRRGRGENPDRPAHLVRSDWLVLLARKDLSGPWGLPGLRDRKVSPEASGRSDLQAPSAPSARLGSRVLPDLRVPSVRRERWDLKGSRGSPERFCASSCRNAHPRVDAWRAASRTSTRSTAPATVATVSIWMKPACTASPLPRARKG
jgi:hypothetical protein